MLYSVWIKIDDSLPWIELEEAFRTRAEAQKVVKERLKKAKIKIAELTKQEKQIKTTIKMKHYPCLLREAAASNVTSWVDKHTTGPRLSSPLSTQQAHEGHHSSL